MSDDWELEQLLVLGLGGLGLLGLAAYYAQRALFGANAPAAPVVAGGAAAPAVGGPPGPPPPPPALHAAVPNVAGPSLADELVAAKASAIRTTARLRGMEDIRGHLLARHGPALTDNQLQSRLTTGLDSEGVPAPTAGVSSRFDSLDDLTSSVNSVFTEIALALRRTNQALRENLTDYANAEAAFVVAQAGNNGPAIGAANLDRNQKRTDLLAAIASTATAESAQAKQPFLPVYWNNARQRIELFERYVIIYDHQQTIGSGYHGTQPRPGTVVNGIPPKGTGATRNMTIYGKANAYNGPLSHTLTVVLVRGVADRSIARRHDVREWSFITHYPTGQTAGGIALQPGFCDFQGTD